MLIKHFFLFLKEYITNFVHHPPLQSSTRYGCRGGNGLELILSLTFNWILLQPLFRLLYLLIVIYLCILLPLDLVFQKLFLVDNLRETIMKLGLSPYQQSPPDFRWEHCRIKEQHLILWKQEKLHWHSSTQLLKN